MTANDPIDDFFRGKTSPVYKQLDFGAAGRTYTVKCSFARSPDDGSLLPIMYDVIPHWIDSSNFDQLIDGELAANCLARDWGKERGLTVAEARMAIVAKVRDEGDETPPPRIKGM